MACNKKQFYLIKYDRFQSDILPVSSLMLHAIGVLQYRSRIDNCLFACSTFLADKTNPSIHQFRINTRENVFVALSSSNGNIPSSSSYIYSLWLPASAIVRWCVVVFFFFSSQEKEKKKKRRRPSNDVPDGAYRFFFFLFLNLHIDFLLFTHSLPEKKKKKKKKIRWKGERKNFCLAGQKKKNVFILQWLLLLAVLSVNR